LLELTTGIPVSMSAPSLHTLYHARLDLRDALVIGVSQSGAGTDVNMVLESARRQGAYTIAVTNEAESPIVKAVHEVFLVRAGRQKSVAATKTYTSQLMLFYLIASALGDQITLDALKEIPDHARRSLTLVDQIRELVERYRYMRQCAIVARGLNYANAFELALKLMETCYVVAQRFSAADFLHGPIAMVERDFSVVLFMPPGKTFRDTAQLVGRLKALGAETIAITSADAKAPPATRLIRLPGPIPEIYTPIPYIIPGQIFASLLAEVKGIDPDHPRGLHIVTKTI
jgi:glucosamine--fructose-6-phosphate aminotransferase (isomerizing)